MDLNWEELSDVSLEQAVDCPLRDLRIAAQIVVLHLNWLGLLLGVGGCRQRLVFELLFTELYFRVLVSLSPEVYKGQIMRHSYSNSDRLSSNWASVSDWQNCQ